jgi:hypothetical protein
LRIAPSTGLGLPFPDTGTGYPLLFSVFSEGNAKKSQLQLAPQLHLLIGMS